MAGGGEPAGADGAAGTAAAGGAGVGATPLSDVDDVPGVALGALAGLVDPVPAPDSGLVAVAAEADWALGLRTPRPWSVEAAVPAVS